MLNDKVPWLDELDDTELISSPLLRPLFDLRGIQQLTVEKDLGWRSGSEKALIEKNLDRLEGLVRQQVSKPWPDQRPQTHPMGIAKALKMTKKSGLLQKGFTAFEIEAEQAAISLADSQVPSDPSKLARLFLDRPQDVCAYVNKLWTEYGNLRADNASLRMKNGKQRRVDAKPVCSLDSDQLRKMMNHDKQPSSDVNSMPLVAFVHTYCKLTLNRLRSNWYCHSRHRLCLMD
ncbi:hypothetical protein Tdes44962_MAKER03932 [Teratosphaeria destructans]|uniref:Uncharacterized protein n=1 Tax=Teratosphaeria destructans TaxID=418781 RepID=A0A9W7SNS2_9PEZI|nr:hypothetical protein Tdes44962_MAKER03932 [Teratosphaeria destructans]